MASGRAPVSPDALSAALVSVSRVQAGGLAIRRGRPAIAPSSSRLAGREILGRGVHRAGLVAIAEASAM